MISKLSFLFTAFCFALFIAIYSIPGQSQEPDSPPLITLTAPSPDGAPSAPFIPTAEFTEPEGWSCGDFPCEDDVEGFLQRIRVPEGFSVSHLGKFPGQVMQIAYDINGDLYATVITDAAQHRGAVYKLDQNRQATEYTGEMISPIGLAFQPGTNALYVSSRTTFMVGGSLWRFDADGTPMLLLDNLPCCFQIIDNQPNGMVFGPDGYLYLGVGALTDHAEPANPQHQAVAELDPLEASILRIQPYTGEVTVYASGIRNPYDLTFDATGQFYATDNGLLDGPGDRILKVDEGGHYGWPYWRTRGCEACPPLDGRITVSKDLLTLPPYTLPRGIVAYTGTQFPAEMFNSLFVAFWHFVPGSQRIVRIDPHSIPTNAEMLALYEPEPFVTGLIRPVDVVIAPDGSLVVADQIYGHIWKVSYGQPVGEQATVTLPTPNPESTSALFVTSTPRP